MEVYLQNKYKGTYRILADLDEDTQDFVKDADGLEIDKSFSDFYIPCKSNIKIRHGCGSYMSCYIPSKSKGINILKKIYNDKISETLPIEDTSDKYCSNLVSEIIKNNILSNIDILDYEVYFEFKTPFTGYIAQLVGAKTNGANISPISVRNLPKSTYVINDIDLNKYKESIELLEMYEINKANKSFLLNNKLTKEKGMKPKEFIHKNNLWEEYCTFLKEYKNED